MSPKQKSNPSGHRTTSIKTDTQYSKLFEEFLKTLDPPICSTVNHDSPEDSRSGLQLRDYQNDGVVAVLKATEGGLTRIGVSAPPGAGKTIMFTTLIPMLKPRNNMDAVLIIVPGITLADQAAETLGEHLPDRFKVGIEQGGSRARRGHNIIVATWQSLQLEDRISLYNAEEFKVIIVDEAHHAASPAYVMGYLKGLHYFNDKEEVGSTPNLLAKRNHGQQVPIIGFSATFARMDKRKLSWSFQKVVYHITMDTLLEKKVLSKFVIKSTWSKLQKLCNEMQKKTTEVIVARPIAGSKKVPKAANNATSSKDCMRGGFIEMWKITGTHEFNQHVLKTYQKEAGDRKSTLIFCANLDMVQDLTQKFKQAGIKADSVTTRTPKLKRLYTIRDFRTLRLKVLINCEVLTEGADLPSVDCIILAKPTSSQTSFSQMIGRGLRLSPSTGKTACLILDLFGICSRFDLSVQPSLDCSGPPKKKPKVTAEQSEESSEESSDDE